MNKHLSKISGLAAFAVIAASASAEVAINENLSLDGYAIGSAVNTEGTTAKNLQLVNSGRVYDSVKVALNGKYEDFTAKVSLYNVKSGPNALSADAGLLDAFVTYKTGDIAVTGGKYLGWLGFESFDSPNNAFISYGFSNYASPYATGAKVEYLTKEFSTGISVRDTQTGPGGKFFEGDGDFSNDVGYEAYVLYTGIEKLTVFAGAGYQDVAGASSSVSTYNVWASYALTDKVTLAAEYAHTEDSFEDYSWLTQVGYAVNADLSVAARLTGYEGSDTSTTDGFGYGVASTYTITKNFAVKGEITKTDYTAASDSFSYAVQGLFKF